MTSVSLCLRLVLISIVGCGARIDHADAPVHGYKNGEITHGVGYGHHLHPFYYRGKPRKFYDCAVEDEWEPMAASASLFEKISKHSPIKKFDSSIEKFKKPINDMRKMIRSRSDVSNRSIEHEHAKLVRDINGMSESQPFHKKFKIVVDSDVDDVYPSETSESNSGFKEPNKKIKEQYVKLPKMPFDKYKRFKVVAVKSNQIVKLVPIYNDKRETKNVSYKKREYQPYPFVYPNANMNINLSKGQPRTTFKRTPPQFSPLEQFLLLFPRFP